MMDALWRQIGLAPCTDAFDWSGGETPEDWEQVAGWHGRVSQSSGIKPDGDTPATRRAAFDTLAAATPRLRELLDHHKPYYDRLCAHALVAPTANCDDTSAVRDQH